MRAAVHADNVRDRDGGVLLMGQNRGTGLSVSMGGQS